MKKLRRIIHTISLLLAGTIAFDGYTQDRVVIDQVVGVVGSSAILHSELVDQRRQVEAQGIDLGANPYCVLLEDMLFQKLLYNQAIIDSVEVSDSQIEQEIERRLRFFIQQIGSRDRLEEYYGMSVEELREEFWDPIKEQLLSQRMENKITRHVAVTPSEVIRFYNSLDEDEIPMVESEMTLAKIVIEPAISQGEIDAVVERLETFRQRILDGDSFRTLAILYSDDAGSARRGGELGFYSRGELHPEFEAAVFTLEPGEISEVVETPSGYHIIELIERRGEQFNARHILVRPQLSPEMEQQARQKLDSIRTVVMRGDINFADAARKYSDHRSARSGGIVLNPYTGTTRFKADEMDPNLFFAVDRLEVGEISRPIETTTDEGYPAYKIVTVRERRDPHPANLEQDYDFLQQLALQEKKEEAMRRWVIRRLQSTFVSIHDDFRDCTFDVPWLQQANR